MCIIIDTNVISTVIDKTTQNHANFKELHEWIFRGKGKIIYGGTKYLKEVSKYAVLFTELRKIGKAVYISNGLVDNQEAVVSEQINHPNFDDQHLIALLKVSKCKLICSLDARAYPYFRHALFFQPASNKPRIYSSSRNKSLLCDKNLCELCKPSYATNNKQKEIIDILFQ